jgi:tetratricopeptide (TPR) repeat protein
MGPTQVPAAIERCEEICRMLSADPWSHALALQPLAALHAMAGSLDTAFHLLDESNLRLAAMSASLDAAVSHPEIFVSMLAGDLGRAERHVRQGIRELRRLGERAVLASTEGYLAEILVAGGRDLEASRAAGRCARLASAGDTGAQAAWRRARARVLSRRGEHQTAIGLAREAVDILATTDHLNTQGDAMVDFAVVLAEAGLADDAEGTLAAAISRYRAKGNGMGERHAAATVLPSKRPGPRKVARSGADTASSAARGSAVATR